jgi:thiol-disulfide isomerase/thioredoxin
MGGLVMLDSIQELDDIKLNEVLNSGSSFVVYFWAPWCYDYKVQTAIMKVVAKEYSDRLNFYSHQIERDSELASKLRIIDIPVISFYSKGTEIRRFVQLTPIANISKVLEGMVETKIQKLSDAVYEDKISSFEMLEQTKEVSPSYTQGASHVRDLNPCLSHENRNYERYSVAPIDVPLHLLESTVVIIDGNATGGSKKCKPVSEQLKQDVSEGMEKFKQLKVSLLEMIQKNKTENSLEMGTRIAFAVYMYESVIKLHKKISQMDDEDAWVEFYVVEEIVYMALTGNFFILSNDGLSGSVKGIEPFLIRCGDNCGVKVMTAQEGLMHYLGKVLKSEHREQPKETEKPHVEPESESRKLREWDSRFVCYVLYRGYLMFDMEAMDLLNLPDKLVNCPDCKGNTFSVRGNKNEEETVQRVMAGKIDDTVFDNIEYLINMRDDGICTFIDRQRRIALSMRVTVTYTHENYWKEFGHALKKTFSERKHRRIIQNNINDPSEHLQMIFNADFKNAIMPADLGIKKMELVTLATVREPKTDIALPSEASKTSATRMLGHSSFQTRSKVDLTFSSSTFPVKSQVAVGTLYENIPEMLQSAKGFIKSYFENKEQNWQSFSAYEIADGLLVAMLLHYGMKGVFGYLSFEPKTKMLLGDREREVLQRLQFNQLEFIQSLLWSGPKN